MSNVYTMMTGDKYDAFQWTGEVVNIPKWGDQFEVGDNQHLGTVLRVGPYMVQVGSWVLREHGSGDIFPVPNDMFHQNYSKETPADAA